MKILLVNLLFAAFLLVILVQAQDLHDSRAKKVISQVFNPKQRKQFLGALTGSTSSKGAVTKCKDMDCPAGRVYLGWLLRMRVFQQVVNVNMAKMRVKVNTIAQVVVSAMDLEEEKAGASCKSSVDCETGFHCDQTRFKM